jgi:hypothetical protein
VSLLNTPLVAAHDVEHVERNTDADVAYLFRTVTVTRG